MARLGAVNCDDGDNKGICGKYDVKGFPTIKYFGEDKQSPSDYQQVGRTLLPVLLPPSNKLDPPSLPAHKSRQQP